jgi:hypothetical protein
VGGKGGGDRPRPSRPYSSLPHEKMAPVPDGRGNSGGDGRGNGVTLVALIVETTCLTKHHPPTNSPVKKSV